MNFNVVSDRQRKENDTLIQLLKESGNINGEKRPESKVLNLYEDNSEEKLFLEEKQYSENVIKEQQNFSNFKYRLKATLLAESIYRNIMKPILIHELATTHEKRLAKAFIANSINENDVDELLESFKYKNLYLADIANFVESGYETLLQEAINKKDENQPVITDDDCYDIENSSIMQFAKKLTGAIPSGILNDIESRVQDAMDDFTDSNIKDSLSIMDIYRNSKNKIETDDNQLSIASNLTDDDDISDDELQEALSYNNIKLKNIQNRPCNILEAMCRFITSSIHKSKLLKESYSTPTKNLNINKIINDTKVLYTFLEAMNTLNAIDIDEDYLKNILEDMKDNMNNKLDSSPVISQSTKDINSDFVTQDDDPMEEKYTTDDLNGPEIPDMYDGSDHTDNNDGSVDDLGKNNFSLM